MDSPGCNPAFPFQGCFEASGFEPAALVPHNSFQTRRQVPLDTTGANKAAHAGDFKKDVGREAKFP